MPLVILCGYPCSGKSRRSKEIEELFRTRYPERIIHLIVDHYTAFTKNQLYSLSSNEKIARADLKSQVERHLTGDAIVILDSLNYIKGFRYELYCISKHVKSTQCVVHCETPVDNIREWNKARPLNEQYEEGVINDLVMRFEPPDSRNRWDSPLLILLPEDPLPSDNIIDALIHRKPPPPNLSTQNQPLSSVNFLHELDRRTQTTVTNILDLSHQGLLTGSASLPGTHEKLTWRCEVTMAELRRKRHQFTSYMKMHPVEDVTMIETLFIQYLNKSM